MQLQQIRPPALRYHGNHTRHGVLRMDSAAVDRFEASRGRLARLNGAWEQHEPDAPVIKAW
ncbi:hypothetical protein ABZ567_14900 [Streptomyces sp. NPDC016459]|uniref:hypothetical protein n=1 Tax=Streptomyces sp. NPDC016459 TaxID=3157190 RepID=UPI0033F8C840